MTHADFFTQAITLTASQLPGRAVAQSAEYPMRVADLIRLNYQAVVLARSEEHTSELQSH